MHAGETELWVSPPTASPQYLVRVYSTPHGFVRTVATRQHEADVWSPETEIHPAPAGSLT